MLLIFKLSRVVVGIFVLPLTLNLASSEKREINLSLGRYVEEFVGVLHK